MMRFALFNVVFNHLIGWFLDQTSVSIEASICWNTIRIRFFDLVSVSWIIRSIFKICRCISVLCARRLCPFSSIRHEIQIFKNSIDQFSCPDWSLHLLKHHSPKIFWKVFVSKDSFSSFWHLSFYFYSCANRLCPQLPPCRKRDH